MNEEETLEGLNRTNYKHRQYCASPMTKKPIIKQSAAAWGALLAAFKVICLCCAHVLSLEAHASGSIFLVVVKGGYTLGFASAFALSCSMPWAQHAPRMHLGYT